MRGGGGEAGAGGPVIFSPGPAGGVRDPESLEKLISSLVSSSVGDETSSSSSVRTFNSPGVSVLLAAKLLLLGWLLRMDRSRVVGPPVIFDMLYVENLFDARLSSWSLFLSAARELEAIASNGGVSGGEGDRMRWLT